MQGLSVNVERRWQSRRILVLRVEICLDITMELPDENAVVLTRSNKHSIVKRVENSFDDGCDLSNESLIEKGNVRLGIIVPNFKKVVLTSCEHVSAIFTQISCCDCARVNRIQLAQVDAFEASQTVNSYSLVFGDHDNLSTIFGKLVASNNLSDLYLVDEHN